MLGLVGPWVHLHFCLFRHHCDWQRLWWAVSWVRLWGNRTNRTDQLGIARKYGLITKLKRTS